jgi:hypothetical protein
MCRWMTFLPQWPNSPPSWWARSCRAHGVQQLFVAGGGIRNPALMGRIRALTPPAHVSEFDDLGMSAQGKEAYTMAVIGFLTVHGLPATIPSATGAANSSILGSLTPGAVRLMGARCAPISRSQSCFCVRKRDSDQSGRPDLNRRPLDPRECIHEAVASINVRLRRSTGA